MPIYDIVCEACGYRGEVLELRVGGHPACPQCGSGSTARQMAAPSSLTGRTSRSTPGPGDTTCCGQRPSAAGCAGPGSCCGQRG